MEVDETVRALTDPMSGRLDAALQLALLGMHVIPLAGVVDGVCTCANGALCRYSGKHPLITDWQHSASNDPDQIRAWFVAHPTANLGIHCAKSGLVVIDVDPRNRGHESLGRLEELLSGALPSTVEVCTGSSQVHGRNLRGLHIYYRCDPGFQVKGNLSQLGLPGIDIKHNGFVVAPPSLHISGVEYEWAQGHSPRETDFAPASDEMLSLIARRSHNPRNEARTTETSTPWHELKSRAAASTAYGRAALAQEAERVRTAPIGERNNILNSAAFKVGQLVGGLEISLTEAHESLHSAAMIAFRDEDAAEEIASVLRIDGGALERGAACPREPVRPTAEQLRWADTQGVPPHQDTDSFRERLHELDWAALWADETRERWLVEGVFMEGAGHSIYADAGVGKTILCREIGACLASGRSALGLPEREPMSVVYIDYENNPRTDIRRSLQDMGFTPADLEHLHLLSFPEIAPLNTGLGAQHVRAILEIYSPKIVFFDTASRTVDGPENDNDTWLAFYNHVGKLLKAAGVAYVRIDHEGKSPSAGARGGSAKKGDVDLVWHLKEVSRRTKFTLTAEKARMPLDAEVLQIERLTSPLRHRLVTSSIWLELIKTVEDFQWAQDQLQSLFDDINDGESVGIRRCWDELGSRCKARGVTRKQLDEARRALLSDRNSDDEDCTDAP